MPCNRSVTRTAVAEQLGVEGGDHVGRPADALGLESIAHHVDEIGSMDVDGAVSALRIVSCLTSRRHVTPDDPGRFSRSNS